MLVELLATEKCLKNNYVAILYQRVARELQMAKLTQKLYGNTIIFSNLVYKMLTQSTYFYI